METFPDIFVMTKTCHDSRFMFFVLCSCVWFSLVVSCIWFPCLFYIVSCCVLGFDISLPTVSFKFLPYDLLSVFSLFSLHVCLPLSVVLFPPYTPLLVLVLVISVCVFSLCLPCTPCPVFAYVVSVLATVHICSCSCLMFSLCLVSCLVCFGFLHFAFWFQLWFWFGLCPFSLHFVELLFCCYFVFHPLFCLFLVPGSAWE